MLPRIFSAGLLVLLVCDAAAGADALEGTWRVTVIPDDASAGKQFDDTLTFRGELFASEALKARGFAAAVYESDTRGRALAVAFTARQTGPGGSSVKWQGMAAAGAIEGTLTWLRPDGSTATYSFKGSR